MDIKAVNPIFMPLVKKSDIKMSLLNGAQRDALTNSYRLVLPYFNKWVAKYGFARYVRKALLENIVPIDTIRVFIRVRYISSNDRLHYWTSCRQI